VNLLEPFPAWTQRIDLIFCQNVIIYFPPPVRRKLIEQFHSCLPAHGMLFLGFSETLWNVFDGFRSRDIGGSFVYQKRIEQATAPQRPVTRKRAMPQSTSIPAAKPATIERMPARPLHVIPAPNPAVLDRARNYADRGEFDQAIAEANAVLSSDTLNDEAYVLLGMIYTQQGRWELAIRQLDRARYLRPEAALISFHLASAYAQLGMFEHAQREYRSTLWKLRSHAPDTLIDGVAVAWIGETCQRQLDTLAATTAKGRGR
jgi:chemotaxis protein methyltransferase CheR